MFNLKSTVNAWIVVHPFYMHILRLVFGLESHLCEERCLALKLLRKLSAHYSSRTLERVYEVIGIAFLKLYVKKKSILTLGHSDFLLLLDYLETRMNYAKLYNNIKDIWLLFVNDLKQNRTWLNSSNRDLICRSHTYVLLRRWSIRVLYLAILFFKG